MTPLSSRLRAAALRFFELRSLAGNGPAAVNARGAICTVLAAYGWSHGRIAPRVGLTRDGVSAAVRRARKILQDGSNPELASAVAYLSRLLPQP